MHVGARCRLHTDRLDPDPPRRPCHQCTDPPDPLIGMLTNPCDLHDDKGCDPCMARVARSRWPA